MPACECGNPVDTDGALCPRCRALRVLELGPAASDEEIKSAFHMLVKVWHPDRFPRDARLKAAAEARRKDINAAYVFLASPAEPPGAPSRRSSIAVNSGSAGPTKSPLGALLVALNVLFKCLLLVIGLLLCRYLWIAFNVQDSSSEAAAQIYDFGKDNVVPSLQGPKRRFLAAINYDLERIGFDKTEPAPAAVPAAVLETGETASARQRSGQGSKAGGPHSASGQPALHKLYSYITVGSTRAEVLDQVGEPTASLEDRLVYGRSELYLKDGAVTGWKNDRANPIRVKLWPESAVDPSLRYFTVGSTRDEVLIVQGTPTAFSDGQFEYGTSKVFFENHRVVGWESDPASIPLRAQLP